MMKSIHTPIGAACFAAVALSQPAFAAKVAMVTTLSRVALNPQPLPPKVQPSSSASTGSKTTTQQRGIIIGGGKTARLATPR
jgi:hypothetical protein